MHRRILYGLADALDRIGAGLVLLSIIGAWFTEQVPASAGVYGVVSGTIALCLGVYTKATLAREDSP